MIRIREAILVEGRYDINTVKQVVDTVVLETGGFRIFNDRDQLKLIRRIAQSRGLIILTDSDGAGFVIRNYLKGALPADRIKQAYIPDVAGKERRKSHASKEGKLGVEGMSPAIIEQALRRAGATILSSQPADRCADDRPITKADFYTWGLSGGAGSAARRQQLLHMLSLPEHMTANALLEFINAVGTREEIAAALQQFSDNH
ncbi:MAG: toprim domain-containing protein [Agathobaculum sp.]|jgi:ribonuclease M5|uniref:toprim domain-containing protein n=1 Tax=Agathobaculum sp. TaxID=2048138 RepID=UPI003D8EDA4C